MGRQISEDLKKRMRKALERKRLGYTHHLEIAGRMAEKKIEALFKEWSLDVNDVLFTIVAMSWEDEMIFDDSARDVKFKDVINEVKKQLERKEVRDVGVECFDKGVLKVTQQTGNLIFVKKVGLEYLVESCKVFNDQLKEWNSRLEDKGQAKVETQ